MVQFDNQYRQIKIKIVYYGPALGGKTTCLQHIHRVTDPQRRTKLYSLNTASDRTLFFDLLSLNLGRIRGYRLAMQLYTVPGQVQYNATRRAVLSGADGVVFVADSQRDQRAANQQSLDNLWENFKANGLDRATVPIVMQYNKRDLNDLLAVSDLDADLNTDRVPAFETVAIRGDGVMEGFAAISERTLAAVADKLGVGGNAQAVHRLQEQVRAALRPYVHDPDGVAATHDDHVVTVPNGSVAGDQPLGQDVLVGEAVRANLAMTDLNARLDQLTRQLEHTVRGVEGISRFGEAVASEREPADVVQRLVTTAAELLEAHGVSVMVVPGSGVLSEASLEGLDRDPLLAASDEAGEPIAVSVLHETTPKLLVRDLDGDTSGLEVRAIEAAGFGSGVIAPMVSQDRVIGLLAAYRTGDHPAFEDADLRMAIGLASTAAVGYANAEAWHQLARFNETLERQVAERTKELQASLDEGRRLNRDLGEKNRLLEDAYRELSELDRVRNELITRISHELKTPVTSLVTAAKILDRYRDAPIEKSSRFVTIIRDEADKLSEIVQSVFQASLLADSSAGLERRDVAIEELLRKAVAPLRDLAVERDVTMNVLMSESIERLSCEPETFEAALRAVIKNGIEFNRPGGELRIELRRAERESRPWLVIRVADSGVGIPEQELPHVFETFWQGGNVLTGKPRGVGLGLAIAKRIVDKHGGTIRIQSVVGKGTEVTIAVPATA